MKMQKYFKYLFALLFSVVYFYSCQNKKISTRYRPIAVDSTIQSSRPVEQLLKPYREELDKSMNTVLVISDEEFVKQQPESNLSNLIADLTFQTAKQKNINPDLCLLNFGGLRTSLPKGEITVGKIFELMPFENEIVAVTISEQQFDSLIHYIIKVGGQPVSGIKIKIDKNNSYSLFDAEGNVWKRKKTYTVITTDYLAQGGDHMTFFLHPLAYKNLNIKLRDAIINFMKSKGDKNEHLKGQLDGRIQFIQ